MAEPNAPAGFEGGENFQFMGDIVSAPEWVDRGWASNKYGEPALSVPRGDPYGQPYSSVDAVVGDWVFANTDQTRFAVLTGTQVDVAGKIGTATAPPPPPPEEPPVEEEAHTGYKRRNKTR